MPASSIPAFSSKKKDRKPAEFDLDGVTLVAQQPKSVAILELSSTLETGSEIQQAGAIVRFLDQCLDKPSRQHLHDRLTDPDDDFDMDDMSPVIDWIMQEFGSTAGRDGDRPTTPSSASRGRRGITGSASTAGARSTE